MTPFYLHSDDIALDEKPRYVGIKVPPRRDDLFARDKWLTAPMPEPIRPGSTEFVRVHSRGTPC